MSNIEEKSSSSVVAEACSLESLKAWAKRLNFSLILLKTTEELTQSIDSAPQPTGKWICSGTVKDGGLLNTIYAKGDSPSNAESDFSKKVLQIYYRDILSARQKEMEEQERRKQEDLFVETMGQHLGCPTFEKRKSKGLFGGEPGAPIFAKQSAAGNVKKSIFAK